MGAIEKIFKRILRLFGIIGPSDLLNKQWKNTRKELENEDKRIY
ncbi:MAG: hypothetical protein PUG50_04240 [Eubacteriales bacterium]|nr:hypothetical protein [Fenollaria sp.]MDD7339767.1 hypothetical protein [Eubacteriales bacterium]MDY3106337.1 hypothetical protein [Fenollaria sp.]